MFNQISVKTTSLFVFCLLLLIAVPANAQVQSCFAPGTHVVSDNADNIELVWDIEDIYIAEPVSGDSAEKMILTMKMRNLLPLLSGVAPVGTWNVLITSNGTTRYVRMSTLLGSPRYEYGTVTSLLGIPIFNHQGTLAGSFDQTGKISIPLNKSVLGSPTVGSTFAVEGRTYLNTLGIGLVNLDSTASANYTVLGTGSCTPFYFAGFGMNGDIPVVNDYMRNGAADPAVWRPDTGVWYSFDPMTNEVRTYTHGNGSNGDIPVAGNFDNDNTGDHTFYRPSEGKWYIHKTETNETIEVRFGIAEDMPVTGDFDGDRIDDVAVYRPSSGVWYILNSSNGTVSIIQFGLSEDRPVVGDYDGDRRSDVGVFRPSTGVWYVLKSSDYSAMIIGFGLGTDHAVPGDYDGDGKTDVAIWRPETGQWWILNSDGGSVSVYGWGIVTDKPVQGDFNGNGRTDLAVWRPETGVWYIKYN